jgi:hypothetical protein
LPSSDFSGSWCQCCRRRLVPCLTLQIFFEISFLCSLHPFHVSSVCRSESALMKAARCGHLEVCQVLISAGADVNSMDEGYHAYPRKCFFGISCWYTVFLFFLLHPFHVSFVCRSESALMKAARYGHGYLTDCRVQVCQFLISSGADVNAMDEGYHA